jgi:hypothetical protein
MVKLAASFFGTEHSAKSVVLMYGRSAELEILHSDRQTDRQTDLFGRDRHTDRQTDRQTERYYIFGKDRRTDR